MNIQFKELPEKLKEIQKTNPIIIFDGICNFCNSIINKIIEIDANHKFRFIANQNSLFEKIRDKLLFENDSVVLILNGKIFSKSNAALQIVSQLNLPYKLFTIFYIIPNFIRNYIYDFIARNRYKWFGKRKKCRIPSKEEKKLFIN